MRRKLFYLMFFMPLLSNGQSNSDYKGINFEQIISWEQVKRKAKEENKYIFIDCYASWCGPCKFMEDKVYSDNKVGNYFNDKFISIKLQMDTSKNDDEDVKKRYYDATKIKNEFKVLDFPTYLFFSSDGVIVHRRSGAIKTEDFLKLGEEATNEFKQYYTLLRKYKNGQKDYQLMPGLATTAKLFRDTAIGNRIAEDYINNYLKKVRKSNPYNKSCIQFLAAFTENSQSYGFKLFYYNHCKVDKVMDKNYSQNIVDNIIIREEIAPYLLKDKGDATPNWDILAKKISKKYNEQYSKRTIINAKLKWYKTKLNWPQLIKYNVQKIEYYGLDTIGIATAFTNNMIWEVIFLHCNEKNILSKAIKWQKKIIDKNPQYDYIDTYANLLYKKGRRDEAITWEENAMQIEAQEATKNNRMPNKIYRETLDKMKAGIPTWNSIQELDKK